MTDLFIFAGEPSGDTQGALLLKQLSSHLHITGVGGPKMRPFFTESIMHMEEFRVMGFLDVITSLPKLAKKFFALKKCIIEINPKVILFIDYPGFTLRLERSLKKSGFKGKIVHFVCPSVWAWGKKRIPLMENTLDLLLVLFPFETACFTHLQTIFVGHPLVKTIAEHQYQPLPFLENKKVLSIFPGSRFKEIEKNFSLQLEAAKHHLNAHPDWALAISIADKRFIPLIEQAIQKHFPKKDHIFLIEGEFNYELMKKTALAIATSGTITLELALHHVPTAVTFAIHPLDVFIARRIFRIRLPHYCLVNILMKQEVFPELFGPNFTKDALLTALQSLSENPKTCQTSCQKLCNLLGNTDSAKEAAKHISALL